MCEGRAWERQDYDTDASWLAFSEHYLTQQPPRSVNAAFRSYRGLEGDTNKQANGYFRRWSRAHGEDDQPIPDALNWEDRATAYDTYVSEQRAARREQASLAIEDDELTDYERELTEWRRRFDVLMTAPGTMDTFEVTALFKLRKEIADLGRRAVGLPDKVQRVQAEHTGKDGGAIVHNVRLQWGDTVMDDDGDD